jgi:hypothetical protein
MMMMLILISKNYFYQILRNLYSYFKEENTNLECQENQFKINEAGLKILKCKNEKTTQ